MSSRVVPITVELLGELLHLPEGTRLHHVAYQPVGPTVDLYLEGDGVPETGDLIGAHAGCGDPAHAQFVWRGERAVEPR